MQYQIKLIKSELYADIRLPASKSVSNRLLILNELSERKGILENLSDSDDTRVMEKALSAGSGTIDIGHAGTAMRFLTAFLSIREGEWLLTGSERMRQRPIGQLVEALREIGARIEYAGKQGYPPLRIQGGNLAGGDIRIDSSISSQYISALMMIGPALKDGLNIHLLNDVVSSSYIRLTGNLMRDLGIQVRTENNRIDVPAGIYRGRDLRVEGDWSAASYWYAILSLAGKGVVEIGGLNKGSYQGDSILPELFRPFGIKTEYTAGGIRLEKVRSTINKFEFHFGDNPDLVQTMAVLCCMLDLPFKMTGTGTLRIKETDRINALQVELKKLGYILSADDTGNWISWDGTKSASVPGEKIIQTYQDHRMAMAFVPAAIQFPGLIIEDPDVVRKSYPGFWEDIRQAGFSIENA